MYLFYFLYLSLPNYRFLIFLFIIRITLFTLIFLFSSHDVSIKTSLSLNKTSNFPIILYISFSVSCKVSASFSTNFFLYRRPGYSQRRGSSRVSTPFPTGFFLYPPSKKSSIFNGFRYYFYGEFLLVYITLSSSYFFLIPPDRKSVV